MNVKIKFLFHLVESLEFSMGTIFPSARFVRFVFLQYMCLISAIRKFVTYSALYQMQISHPNLCIINGKIQTQLSVITVDQKCFLFAKEYLYFWLYLEMKLDSSSYRQRIELNKQL